MIIASLHRRIAVSLSLAAALAAGHACGQHQTPDFTPLDASGQAPFRITLREYDFGAAALPRLHSYSAGRIEGKWVLIAGRTNGVHDLNQSGEDSFPEESQSRDVWVIDPVAKQSWHRSLGDPAGPAIDPVSGLTPDQIASLTPTNNQFTQAGNRLYLTGGYGLNVAGEFTTFDRLTALDLPGIVDWVTTGAGTAADHIRQLDHSVASVTGGAMYEMGGRMHIVFGQDFEGPYSPRTEGAYTRQVRSFDIIDDGATLAIANITETPPLPEFRRRDLNVAPVLRPDGAGGVDEGLVALSGVFTPSFGVFTVPVEIDAAGHPTMADPASTAAFKQGFNGYHSAKLGLFSEATGAMHEVLFGGISVQYLDESTNLVMRDDGMPWVNDVTSIAIGADGVYSQHHLGFFPEILDSAGRRWRFGANAEFFANEAIPAFGNGVIDLDQLTGETSLGFIFGGIATNGPHTSGFPEITSTASHRIFEVVYAPIPEPSSSVLAILPTAVAILIQRRRVVSLRTNCLFSSSRFGRKAFAH